MKRTIRNSVFESNSSSCHAICVSKKSVNMNKIDVKMVRFNHGEFGWENDEYDSVTEKASYLYQAIFSTTWVNYNWNDKEDKSRAKNERKILIQEKLSMLEKILDKYNIICDFDEEHYDENGWEIGYIDHGRELDDWVDKCLSNEEYLLTYLFGDSFIITGNDNEDEYREDDWDYTLESEFDNYDVYEKGN